MSQNDEKKSEPVYETTIDEGIFVVAAQAAEVKR